MEKYIDKKTQRSAACVRVPGLGKSVSTSHSDSDVSHFSSSALSHVLLFCGSEDAATQPVILHLSLFSTGTFNIMLCPNCVIFAYTFIYLFFLTHSFSVSSSLCLWISFLFVFCIDLESRHS